MSHCVKWRARCQDKDEVTRNEDPVTASGHSGIATIRAKKSAGLPFICVAFYGMCALPVLLHKPRGFLTSCPYHTYSARV